ncbi:hypothetical protein MC885_021334 [Smutsia gigantea]|nr:hypothetical protein MC885_021334 [Smutsia gigantea]
MAAASRARGWAPRPLLLLPLLLGPFVPAGCAAAARLSLHPPYFNLAEAVRIWATATCGEREPGSARPRPELYCKLVGGPTAPGSGHTIQMHFTLLPEVPPFSHWGDSGLKWTELDTTLRACQRLLTGTPGVLIASLELHEHPEVCPLFLHDPHSSARNRAGEQVKKPANVVE